MIRTIYGFDDLGRKVPTGSYDDGAKVVGGRIFYIDDTSTATYEFYDAQGNKLTNVAVGDTPAYSKKLTTGNGKDKYYVYYDVVYSLKYWTYMDNGHWVNEDLGTETSIGIGKSNTSVVMSKDNGAYITTISSVDTVWKLVDDSNKALLGGCNDWYLGSKDEIETLNVFMVNSPNVTNRFTNKFIQTSSESSTTRYWVRWNNNNDSGADKSGTNDAILIRSF